MRVLHISHTSVISGAEQSLLVLLRAHATGIEAELACPEGELATAARAAGVRVHTIRGTDVSARLHPWHTTRELVRAAGAAVALRRLARWRKPDVLHANTPRAAMLAWSAAAEHPLVVHVRDAVPPGRLPRALFSGLGPRTAAWILTSRFLAETLPVRAGPGGGRPLVRVIANAVEPGRFDPATRDRAQARAALALTGEEPVLALVGQISPHKGQREAIEMLSRIRRAGVPAQLLVVGAAKFTSAAARFDNRAYERECRELAVELGVGHAVRWLGERSDVARVLAAADLALVPSWYEPFGRVALEAMSMRVPALVTAVGGVSEVVRDGRDGLVLEPRRPELWARAALELLDDPARRASMGAQGRRRALEDFGPQAHADALAATYRALAPGNRHAHRPWSDSLALTSDPPPLRGSGAARG